MCQLDPTTETQLEITIRQFLDEGRMFTGYDVTLETREREHVQMRHKDVRGGIHEIQCLIDACDWGHEDPQGNEVRWKKSQVNMPGGQWAFVYHPETADPNQYQPRGAGQSTPAPATAAPSNPVSAPVPVAVVSDSGGPNTNGTFSTDYRNRLMVRTEFVKEVGSPGDTVEVIMDSDNKRILLSNGNFDAISDSLGGPSGKQQEVERQGDLRLYSRTLRSADLDVAEDFVIEPKDLDVNGQQIRVVEIRNAS